MSSSDVSPLSSPLPKRRKLLQQPSLLTLARDRVNKQSADQLTWGYLPLELLMRIFWYLQPKDRMSVSLVCSHWHSALNIPALWTDSFVFLKKGLKTKPVAFWTLIHQRGFINFGLQGKNVDKDLLVLHENLTPTTVRGLKLVITQRHPVQLEILNTFTTLTVVHLEFTCFTTSQWLSSIRFAGMSLLVDLTLSGVSDLGLYDFSYLAHPQLHSLTIRNCGSFTAKETRKFLLQFPSLRKLNILSCKYYNGFVPDSIGLDNNITLTHLNLSRTVFDLVGSLWPSMFSLLMYIDLVFCMQSEANLLEMLSSLPLLEEIHIKGNHCTDDVLSALKCKNLKKIDLTYNHVSLMGLMRLSALAKHSLVFLGLECLPRMTMDQFVCEMKLQFPCLRMLDYGINSIMYVYDSKV